MNSTDMAIIRFLTNRTATLEGIWRTVRGYGESLEYICDRLEEWQIQGYVAKLDDGYCLTR